MIACLLEGIRCLSTAKNRVTLGSIRASSEGRAIRQVELLSNKLLTTAFEASLGCVAVMRRAKRRQRGSRDSYRAPKYQQTRASTLWSEGKTICGFIVKVRFHTALRCRRELFMLYKDCIIFVAENLLVVYNTEIADAIWEAEKITKEFIETYVDKTINSSDLTRVQTEKAVNMWANALAVYMLNKKIEKE